jgi:hypothetical protein
MAVPLKKPNQPFRTFHHIRCFHAGLFFHRWRVAVVTSEVQSCMERLQDAAQVLAAALEDAKRAGLEVTLERTPAQSIAVKCGPPEPAHDHDDGGGPLWGSLA